MMTRLVIGVPELVMNCLVPLMTHTASSPSPSSTAVVSVAAASEPALASVRPNPASARPASRSGSQRFFCSSVPYRWRGPTPRPIPASRVTAML